MFSDQLRWGKYECSRIFFSVKMEESDCLLKHIANMDLLYDELTNDWESWTDHSMLIQGVLGSLPPSYADVVKEYVMSGSTLYFLQFLDWLKTKHKTPEQVEVIDLAGISIYTRLQML